MANEVSDLAASLVARELPIAKMRPANQPIFNSGKAQDQIQP